MNISGCKECCTHMSTCSLQVWEKHQLNAGEIESIMGYIKGREDDAEKAKQLLNNEGKVAYCGKHNIPLAVIDDGYMEAVPVAVKVEKVNICQSCANMTEDTPTTLIFGDSPICSECWDFIKSEYGIDPDDTYVVLTASMSQYPGRRYYVSLASAKGIKEKAEKLMDLLYMDGYRYSVNLRFCVSGNDLILEIANHHDNNAVEGHIKSFEEIEEALERELE